MALFAFIRFTANRCSKSDSLKESHAREAVTAHTNSAAPYASTRTVAAESVAADVETVAVALWATTQLYLISTRRFP